MFQATSWMASVAVCLFAAADSKPQAAASVDRPIVAPVKWYDDYGQAMREAKQHRKMLLVWFHAAGKKSSVDITRTAAYQSQRVRDQISRYVCVKLPLDATIVIGGQPKRLIQHGAFRELYGQEGISIVDLANAGTSHYGYVVSSVPFGSGKYYRFRPEHLPVLLELPAGSLTQRMMVFAVRIHPEAPASTHGTVDNSLMKAAQSHSSHQASIGVQGHHQWESRYQHISSSLPGGLRAQEVVAESWPNERLVDACVDCVDSWRQSSGHWSAVRRSQPRFGYDIRLGRNGIWYATGLFGNRH